MKYQTYHITEEHLAIYEKWARCWVNLVGLKGWELSFFLKRDPSIRARIAPNLEGHVVSFFLGEIWKGAEPTEANLRRSALHEILELMLYRYDTLARNRFLVCEGDMEEARHEVIHYLENLLMELCNADKMHEALETQQGQAGMVTEKS